MTESSVLALAGGAVGVLLAYWSVDLLVAASPENVPRIDEVTIDGTVLGFSAVLALATGILFGLAPALQSSRPDLNHALKDSVRGSTRERNRVRGLLVVAEVALALVLLISANLLIKSFWRLQVENPGFNPDHVLAAKIVLTGSAYPESEPEPGAASEASPSRPSSSAALSCRSGIAAVGTGTWGAQKRAMHPSAKAGLLTAEWNARRGRWPGSHCA